MLINVVLDLPYKNMLGLESKSLSELQQAVIEHLE